ncbi:MAG TPA: hypothetical protein VF158_12450 [Longimicrobiales bacterium]
MTLRTALTYALAGACALLALRSCAAGRDAEAYRAENTRLRAQAAQARLQAQGYHATLAHVARSLRSTLAERDHWRALAEEPDVEPVALVEASVEAEAHVEAVAEPMRDTTRVVVGYHGEAADSVFALRWRFLLGPPPRFAADVRARVPLELVAYRLPDGALGVTAASRDERVRVQVQDFVWEPPEPQRPSRWKWVLLAGMALGAAGWEALR